MPLLILLPFLSFLGSQHFAHLGLYFKSNVSCWSALSTTNNVQPLSFHSLPDSLIRQACNVGVPEVCHCWSAPAKQSQLLPEYQSSCADKNAELLILREAFHVYTQACRCTFPASEVMNESFMHNKTERWELRRAVEAHSLPSVSSNQYVQQSRSYWHF